MPPVELIKVNKLPFATRLNSPITVRVIEYLTRAITLTYI